MRLSKLSLMILPVMAIAVLAPTPRSNQPQPVRQNWNNLTNLTQGGGHRLGNPAAQLRLMEYASYTCSHCAEFEIEANSALRVGYIASGQVSYEVRHLVRDPIDLTVAMLANCGVPSRFFLNHAAYMRSQSRWLAPVPTASAAQRARWTTGDALVRRRNIATDLHLYEIAASRGYDRITADRCLADEAMAQRLATQTGEASALQIAGTPAFLLNGALLVATYNWQMLRPQLDARL